jgi:hypothetical protein
MTSAPAWTSSPVVPLRAGAARPAVPRRRLQHALAALCVGLLAAAQVHADRPLVTETADVLGPGQCQLEAAAARARPSGAPSQNEAGATFSCGTPLDTQLAVTYVQLRSSDLDVKGVVLGGKTMLRAPAEGRIGFGVSYSVAGVQEAGAAFETEAYTLLGLTTVELTRGLLGHANLGLRRSQTERLQRTVWSFGLETDGSDLVFAADLYGNLRSGVLASVGAGYDFGGGFSLNAAYAYQFEAPRVRQWLIGAKLEFF